MRRMQICVQRHWICLLRNVLASAHRPTLKVYPWTVRDPLPTIPIPLNATDAGVHVDLSDVFKATYERGRYAKSLRYGKKPLAPLGGRDAKWAMALSVDSSLERH